MDSYLSYFIYGQPVSLKFESARMACVMMTCESNLSFLEFINPTSFKVVKYLYLYHVRDVHIELKTTSLIIRMRNYKENFKIKMKKEADLKLLAKNFRLLLKRLKKVPNGEYSIKNMIRYALYFSEIAKLDNNYTLDDINQLMYRLRIKLHKDEHQRLVRKAVADINKITSFDFRRIFKILLLKEELADYYKEIAELAADESIGKTKITVVALKNWLEKKQREEYALEELQTFFKEVKSANVFKLDEEEVDDIDFEDFCLYIYSKANSAWDKAKVRVYQDLSQPLNHYYCSSSHNTYLIGHQLYGRPGFEGYKRALENGTRCLEIDCWDGPNNSPVVTHGKTFCSNLLFKDLIETLAKVAFEDSDFPLILSLEMHCSRSQRDVIAKIIIENFDDKLFLLSKNSYSSRALPSLESLKHKVLIKCKAQYPAHILTTQEKEINQPHELLHQITSLHSEKYNPGGLRTVWGIVSFDESKIEEYTKNVVKANGLIDFNKRHLTRIYPDPKRIDSTNYNPTIGWNLGCQYVALNIQKNDRFTLLNYLRFRENGSHHCGYVLKPDILRQAASSVDREEITKVVYIKILSSQIIEKNLSDDMEYVYPFIEVEVFGHEKDMVVNKAQHTKIYQNNLLHSLYMEDDAKLFKLPFYYPELAFISFTIRNARNNELVKSTMIPVSCLAKGIRSLDVYDSYNTFDSFSQLLLEIDY